MKKTETKNPPAQASLWEPAAPAPANHTEKLEEATARHRRATTNLARARHQAAAHWNNPAALKALEEADDHAQRCKHALRLELAAMAERRWKRNETDPQMQRLMGHAQQNWMQA